MQLRMSPSDALSRGVADGDLVRASNARGEVLFHAQVTGDVPAGVVVAPGVRRLEDAEGGRTVNALTAQRLTDQAGGSTFYDTAVVVERVGPTARDRGVAPPARHPHPGWCRRSTARHDGRCECSFVHTPGGETVIDAYAKHKAERKAQGIPAKPLDPEQTGEVCKLLENPPAGKGAFLLGLLENRVSPGVDPAAEVKASFLADVISGKRRSPVVSRKDAVRLLGTMLGGYNVAALVGALSDAELAGDAARALAAMTQVYDAFDDVLALSKTNSGAKRVLDAWANAEWFTSREGVPAAISNTN